MQSENIEKLVERMTRPASNVLGKVAIVHRERELNYSDLDELASRAETLLKENGIARGDRFLIVSPNCPEVFAAMLAGFRLGALVCPVDFRITPGELTNIASRLQIKCILAGMPLDLTEKTSARVVSLNDIGRSEPASSKGASGYASLSDPAFLILTSGTTGMPKGALHDLASLAVNISELAEMAGLSQGDKLVLPVPLSHVLGLEVTFAALLNGCSVIMSEMTIEGIVSANNKHKPQFLVGVPTIYGAIAALDADKIDLSAARVLLCGGAPLNAALAEQFEARHGKRLNNGYGSTESKIIAVNLVGPIESVGKVIPSCTIKILDSENNPLPEGSEGEIVICGPMLMLGYIGQKEATEAVMRDQCYFTGDVGYVKDQYLFISGRAKEMINVAGNKVFPAEVEGALKNCPLVKEVAVIGVAHSKLGQIVKAHIVTTDSDLSARLAQEDTAKDAKASLKEKLRQFSQEHLKRELRPMEWVFYPEDQILPRTLTGKIDKKQLN